MGSLVSEVESIVFSSGFWLLFGAILVFFMQCGFAMVESGFTRAKNAGNIIMKNLMDFCIGTVMFALIGYSLMCGQDYVAGIIGVPTLGIFTDYANFDWANFVFNLMFCATAATIVSGSMAERTKFSSYCIYSAVISLVVYPIEAGWVWNVNGSGWLQQLGFHDYAGSCAIHMVGGIAALVGAIIVGPRIGKYKVDKKTGKLKAKAIPGHSLTLGALGVFILWFAWYGFNGAAADSVGTLATILVTTTIAPAAATVTTMIFTWVKDGKPDVSMSLNGSLAGLVAITASCDVADAFGSAIIGIVSGFLVVFVVELLDKKLHIDDPVGAVAVHMANGIWGTLAVGLFATEASPAFAISGIKEGLFYGGGFEQLGIQFIGFASIVLWTALTMTATFLIIKKTVKLRVEPEEEIAGLDATEHNLPSAYADFMPASYALQTTVADIVPASSVEKAVPVESYTAKTEAKLTKVVIIFNPVKFEELKESMNSIGITGMTVINAMGCGIQKGHVRKYRGVEIEEMSLNPKMKMEMVVSAIPVATVVDTVRKVLYTGNIGDGKIFIYDVEDVIKVRTGERGYDALQGEN